MTVTIISIYFIIGTLIAFLVDLAYTQRDKGSDHFKDVPGEFNHAGRIMTVLLWPIVVTFAVIGMIRENRKR
jgi:hypothetical protein